jgi:hypothetical protein
MPTYKTAHASSALEDLLAVLPADSKLAQGARSLVIRLHAEFELCSITIESV